MQHKKKLGRRNVRWLNRYFCNAFNVKLDCYADFQMKVFSVAAYCSSSYLVILFFPLIASVFPQRLSRQKERRNVDNNYYEIKNWKNGQTNTKSGIFFYWLGQISSQTANQCSMTEARCNEQKSVPNALVEEVFIKTRHSKKAYRNSWTLYARVGRWTLDTGLWTLDARLWTLDFGRQSLDAGRWTLDADHWALI